jgi:tRNA nucleotidyltransferase/poly(A) polymerase
LANAAKITLISPERVRMELALMLPHPRRAVAWQLLDETGLLEHLCPGCNWPAAERERIKGVLAGLPEEISFTTGVTPLALNWTREAMLRFARGLRFSNAESDALTANVPTVHALLAKGVELADLKQWLAHGRFAGCWAVARAVATADGQPLNDLEAIRARAEAIPRSAWAPEPWVTGEDLIAMNIPASPIYAHVLAQTYRAQRNESLAGRDEALAMARRLIAESSDPC